MEATSDDDSLNDAASVTSGQSDNRSLLDEANDNEVEDSVSEKNEEKLRDAIDGMTQKSAKGRTSCLTAVENYFALRYGYSYFILLFIFSEQFFGKKHLLTFGHLQMSAGFR